MTGEEKKTRGTHLETRNRPCLTGTQRPPLEPGIVRHTVGSTLPSHAASAGGTDSLHSRHPSTERPLHREQAQPVKSCYINPPFLPLHSLLREALEIKARLSQGHLLFLWPWPRTVTLSQYDPDESLPFSYIQTFSFSGYPQKYHLGLRMHNPSSSTLTFYT